MISIRDYLYLDAPNAGMEPAGAGTFRLCDAALEGIERYVLTGAPFEPLRARLYQLRALLRPVLAPEEASPISSAISGILGEYRAQAAQTAAAQAVEMQHIMAMLNEALIVLAEGRDRSVSRLNKIREALQQASVIEDIVALKASLADTMKFIRKESLEAQESAARDLGLLEDGIKQARESLGFSRPELPGRAEAVAKITASLENPPAGEALYVVAYLLDQLRVVTQRYGPSVADEVLFRLVKERVNPVAPSCSTYRWAASIVAVLFRPPFDAPALRAQVADLNRTPIVHRTSLGSRTAVLTVRSSHLVAEGAPGAAEALIGQLDKFAGGA